MRLDTSGWGKFRIDSLFSVSLASGDIKAGEELKGDIPLISSGSCNNGVVDHIACGDGKSVIFDGNKITVDMFGNAFYQDKPFYTVSHGRVNILTPKFKMTQNIALFITALINMERYKYSYGRAVYGSVVARMEIRLPVKKDGEPDWQFMENYMKTLHHKPLTTKNRPGNAPKLETEKWGKYLLDEYFDIVPGKYHYSNEYEQGDTPYYSASSTNNGISQYINLAPDFEGNCIVTGKIGSTAFYAPVPFCATSDVNVLIPKFNMTRYVGLFVSAVINYSENYKWAYGRQCRIGNTKRIWIKLPTTSSGTPNWQFMEDYIKALPYGDRL